MKNILLISGLLLSLTLQAKQPLSHDAGPILEQPELMTLTMPAEMKRKPSAKDGDSFKPQPLQIARTVTIKESLLDLAPWQTVNNQAYSRLQLQGQKAKHFILGFENVALPESAHMYIIDATTNKVLHHYTAKDILRRSIWTPMLDTRNVIIEINVLAWERNSVSVQLKQAGLGTRSKLSTLQKSGSCNIDVVCSEGDNWRDVIRSVARYTISNSQGTFLCTGTLMNNDNQDHRPLFLTAAHCGASESTADNMTIYWNYETSVCGGTPDGSLAQFQTGVNYLSRSEGIGTESDYALVELLSIPSDNYMVHYSGWNAVAQNASNVVTIHHPAGDEKRISLDTDPLTITGFNSTDVDESQDYYRIGAWDVGTTEGGSSGSGIWNANKELIGTLSGGIASCDALDQPDWYGRMSSHWQRTDDPLNQLAMYLAPNTGGLTLAGFEPCGAADIQLGVSEAVPAVNEQFNFSSIVSGGTGPYTYAWDFNGDGTTDATDANPAHAYASAGKFTAKVDVTDANQCKTSARVAVSVPDATETFAIAGTIPDGYIESATANAGWVGTSATASEGAYSLRAEIINENEVSAIEYTANFEQGAVSFSYRVSSELDYDFFKFYVDNVEQISNSGEVDWTPASVNIAAGSRTLKWTFEKDASVSGGLDTAWVDGITLPAIQTTPPPPPPPVTPPSSGGGGGGSTPIWLLVSLLFYRCGRLFNFGRRETAQ